MYFWKLIMKVIFGFFFSLVFFSCSSDKQVDYKAVHCGLINSNYTTGKSILVLHENDVSEPLNDLSWEFTYSSNFDDILPLEPVSIVLVSKSYLDLLNSLPTSIKNQFSFLFQTKDFLALKKSNKLEYVLNLLTPPPSYIRFKSKTVETLSTNSLLNKILAASTFVLCVKSIKKFKTNIIVIWKKINK